MLLLGKRPYPFWLTNISEVFTIVILVVHDCFAFVSVKRRRYSVGIGSALCDAENKKVLRLKSSIFCFKSPIWERTIVKLFPKVSAVIESYGKRDKLMRHEMGSNIFLSM